MVRRVSRSESTALARTANANSLELQSEAIRSSRSIPAPPSQHLEPVPDVAESFRRLRVHPGPAFGTFRLARSSNLCSNKTSIRRYDSNLDTTGAIDFTTLPLPQYSTDEVPKNSLRETSPFGSR